VTKYVVAAAALGVPTGKENPLTRLPDVVRFVRGQVVDSEKFDTEAGRNKIERLLRQGALRDPEDVPPAAQQTFRSEFDIPLDRDPGGQPPQSQIVKLPGDDIEDDGADGSEDPLAARLPSLVDGTPEARLQGQAVDPAETGGDAAPEPEEADGTNEELRDTDGDGIPEAPSRGASTAVWQQYAQRAKLDVPADASRAEIQAAYDKRVTEQG
jgi:hypothetical protein